MKQVLTRICRSQIRIVVADREFIGKEWFTWLQTQNIPFVPSANDQNAMVYIKEIPLRKLFFISKPSCANPVAFMTCLCICLTMKDGFLIIPLHKPLWMPIKNDGGLKSFLPILKVVALIWKTHRAEERIEKLLGSCNELGAYHGSRLQNPQDHKITDAEPKVSFDMDWTICSMSCLI